MDSGSIVSAALKDIYLEGTRKDIEALDAGVREASAAHDLWPRICARMSGLTHNVKAQGEGFGYPLMTRTGQSLSDLLRGMQTCDARSLKLLAAHVAAHVAALRAVLDKDIAGSGGQLGAALIARLDALVGKVA